MHRLALALPLALAACSEPAAPTAMDAAADAPADDIVAQDLGVTDVPDVSDVLAAQDVPPAPIRCELGDAAVNLPSVASPMQFDASVDGGPSRGPGGPRRSFRADELDRACAYLHGGPTDRDHHNGVFILDGHLYMPWAHESGGGGVSVWTFDDPCAPVHVGTTIDARMRETHAPGFQFSDRRWMVATSLTGIQFWDITDPAHPRMVRDLTLPGVVYPDSYQRVVMSTFWQAPYVYVGSADNGVFIVDARDPENPSLVRQVALDPPLRVGGVHAIGNLLVVMSTEGSRTALLDLSDPANPRPIPGGSFLIDDGTLVAGRPRVMTSYMGHVNGNRAYHARHITGGGLIVYDITDFSRPTFMGNYRYPGVANGGYVFIKEDTAFVGLSSLGVALDIRDPAAMTVQREFHLTGDLDFVNPIGNVAVLSVDDDAVRAQSTSVVPYEREPDRRAPRVNMVVPRDNATGQALTTRVGVTFDEFVDMATVGAQSFIVREEGATAPLEGWYSGQEGAVNFWPARPLRPGTRYELIVPAGGVQDYSGNPTAETFRMSFRTGDCAP
ncbi:MAG: Ig-like domain-containing protein [Polyangiales bacterium]